MSSVNWLQSKGLIQSIPTPSSISYMWSFGSILGLFLSVQIVSGLILSFYYTPLVSCAFESVIELTEDIPLGWVVRSIHANGASFFFISMYIHIARGIYFESYKNSMTWSVGVVIFLVSMATAFLGYVLPWGQMSYWGATVITNLLSSLPKGSDIVIWVWGGFSVGGPTLSRFFSLHFLLPFSIAFLVVSHIFLLHDKGSQNPLGLSKDSDKVFFHPYFVWKDMVGFVTIMMIFFTIVLSFPDMFMDPDNFIPANSLSTPAHIQPEWYFLFAYAILRSIPSKLGGVVALFMSILVLLGPPLFPSPKKKSGLIWSYMFWSFVVIFILLTWVGSMPAEGIMVQLGQVLTVLYFSFFILVLLM